MWIVRIRPYLLSDIMEKYRLYKGAWVSKLAPHKQEKISSEEAKDMLARGGLLVRNSYDWDEPKERNFWYVIKDSYGGIEELPTKVRNQVRKSQQIYEFKQVDAEEMILKGYELFNLGSGIFLNTFFIAFTRLPFLLAF